MIPSSVGENWNLITRIITPTFFLSPKAPTSGGPDVGLRFVGTLLFPR